MSYIETKSFLNWVSVPAIKLLVNCIKVFLIFNVKFLQNYNNISLEMGKEIFDMRHNTDRRLTPELHKEENKLLANSFGKN